MFSEQSQEEIRLGKSKLRLKYCGWLLSRGWNENTKLGDSQTRLRGKAYAHLPRAPAKHASLNPVACLSYQPVLSQCMVHSDLGRKKHSLIIPSTKISDTLRIWVCPLLRHFQATLWEACVCHGYDTPSSTFFSIYSNTCLEQRNNRNSNQGLALAMSKSRWWHCMGWWGRTRGLR